MTLQPLFQALLGAGKLACMIVLVIVPLVTLFEVFRHARLLRRAGKTLDALLGGMGLSAASSVPLVTGMLLGISYGAGIMLRTTRERPISRRELFLVGLFLSACHGVIEDTLIFVVIGANGWVMLGFRLVVAVIITAGLARFWKGAAT